MNFEHFIECLLLRKTFNNALDCKTRLHTTHCKHADLIQSVTSIHLFGKQKISQSYRDKTSLARSVPGSLPEVPTPRLFALNYTTPPPSSSPSSAQKAKCIAPISFLLFAFLGREELLLNKHSVQSRRESSARQSDL